LNKVCNIEGIRVLICWRINNVSLLGRDSEGTIWEKSSQKDLLDNKDQDKKESWVEVVMGGRKKKR